MRAVGARVFERGWLSSNVVLFGSGDGYGATLVDSGYAAHADQTAALVDRHVGAGVRRLRVVNTHLHSDHCGGNALLQQRFEAEAWIPGVSMGAVRSWDMSQLTFDATEQRCDRFEAHCGLAPGDGVALGERRWLALEAPGHDPLALMYFEPESRVLVAGDALWQDGVAIIFPELAGESGFDAAAETLARIQSLRPAVVIPGHGPAFDSVDEALRASRSRLDAFRREPERHAKYAARALVMFRLLERREAHRDDLIEWIRRAPVLRRLDLDAEQVLDRLIQDRVVTVEGDRVCAARI